MQTNKKNTAVVAQRLIFLPLFFPRFFLHTLSFLSKSDSSTSGYLQTLYIAEDSMALILLPLVLGL